MTVECSRLRRSRSSLTKCARCSVAEEHSTFIFVAFLAQSRPTSRRQSSRRAPRAAKQVLEFLSASFGANKFAVHLVSAFLQHPAARCSLLEKYGKAAVWFDLHFFGQRPTFFGKSFTAAWTAPSFAVDAAGWDAWGGRGVYLLLICCLCGGAR